MGWLFGKKKKVPPLMPPGGRSFDEMALRFSKNKYLDKTIEPEQLQAAVDFDKPLNFPEMPDFDTPPPQTSKPSFPSRGVPKPTLQKSIDVGVYEAQESEPSFVKVEVYQEMLGAIAESKQELNELAEINRKLETSEYNEEDNFTKLKRAVRVMHDRLLLIDKTLFKA